jgi:hypothetical protein
LRLNEVRMAEAGEASQHGEGGEHETRRLTILLALALLTIPLSDARSASVGENDSSDSFEVALESIALNGSVDELGSVIEDE